MKKEKKASIRTKIALVIVIIVVFFTTAIGVTGIITTYTSTWRTLQKTMTEVASVSAERVSYQLQLYTNVAAETGCLRMLSDSKTSDDEKQNILNERVATYDYEDAAYVNADGVAHKNGYDMSDIPVVKNALAGQTGISEPMTQDNGKSIYLVAAPIWQNGEVGSTVTGVVVYTLDGQFVNDIMLSINVGETGEAYMINSEGTVIAAADSSLLATKTNSIEDAKTDSSVKEIADMEYKLTQGESGCAAFNWDGHTEVGAYSPIHGTNNWGLMVTVQQTEYMQSVITCFLINVAYIVASIVLGLVIAKTFSKKITKPIIDCSDRLSLLAQGDLHSDIPETNATDETGKLLTDLKSFILRLRYAINDTSEHLDNIAHGDISHEIAIDYDGDMAKLTDSIKKILKDLNLSFGQIDIVSQQVASGADQVASGAQALAQGATEQASSVEELSSSLDNISSSVSETAALTKRADELSKHVGSEVENSNNQMDGMVSAMGDISKSSEEIGRIIKTIEDIAFQTNILALNAAVEAARAGEAGKGFAVVADEVRNLASKSADAAKNTNELISNSLDAVRNGVKITDATQKSLSVVVSGTKEVSEIVKQIAKATEYETEAIHQTTQGLEQISNVVQVTSATAEESAAASEELSGQAAQLRSLLEMLKLNEKTSK